MAEMNAATREAPPSHGDSVGRDIDSGTIEKFGARHTHGMPLAEAPCGRARGSPRAACLKQPLTPYYTAGTWTPPLVWGVGWIEELPPSILAKLRTSECPNGGFLTCGGRCPRARRRLARENRPESPRIALASLRLVRAGPSPGRGTERRPSAQRSGNLAGRNSALSHLARAIS